jgi:4-hydroxybenzoate polyprenyltransferase
LGASGVFILRELLNVEADRHQPAKRLRPFASGDLPLSTGLVMGPILLTASALLASRLPWVFCVALGIYLVLAAAHPPLNFRRGEGQGEGSVPSALVDVLCRTGLYTICLIAGHEATGISFSFWPLFLSILAFLTLALVEHHFLPHDSVLP